MLFVAGNPIPMAKKPSKASIAAQITARISPELKLKIASIAQRMGGISDGELIRQMLEYAAPEFDRRAAEYERIRGEGTPTEEEIQDTMTELAESMRAGVPIELHPHDVNGLRGMALSRLLASLWDRQPPATEPAKPKPTKPAK